MKITIVWLLLSFLACALWFGSGYSLGRYVEHARSHEYVTTGD